MAVGPQAIWTSPTGLTWTLAATHGISPQLPGDSVWVITKTADGFLAAGAGQRANGANHGATQAVIWTSRDGVTWQRMTAAQLGLAGPGETVLNISYATWHGNATVISGTVSAGAERHYDAAWLSTNDGAAWTRVTIPADHGAGTAITGLGFDGSGLIAVRPGRTASGAADGVAYFSPNGQVWQYSATIDPAGGWTPGLVKGSDYGFVVTGTSASGQLVGYTSTGTGTTWLPTGLLGNAAAESVVGATVAPAGTIVAVGYTAASKVSQQPVFLEASTDGTVRPVQLTSLAGAAVPEMAIHSTAVAGGVQVAVGSANGYPAVWWKTAGGAWTLVSSLALTQPLGGANPGLRALTSVTHGGRLARRGRAGTRRPDLGRRHGLGGGRREHHPGPDRRGRRRGDLRPGRVRHRRQAGRAGRQLRRRRLVVTEPDQLDPRARRERHDRLEPGARGRCGRARLRLGGLARQQARGLDDRQRDLLGDDRPAGAGRGRDRRAPAGRDQRQPRGRPGPGHAGRWHRREHRSGTVPFAELSVDGGATWQQVPFSSPGPDTTFTALTAAGSAGFTAAGMFGQPGQQDVAVWTSATGVSWKPSQSSGLNGSEAWQIDALAPSGTAVTGIGTIVTQQSQQTVTFTLPPAR